MMPTKRRVKHYIQVESSLSRAESFNGLAVQAVRVYTLPLRKAVGSLDDVIRTTGYKLKKS